MRSKVNKENRPVITDITYILVHSDINIIISNVSNIILKVYNLIWNYINDIKLNYIVELFT